ncbi:hypothetical protein G6F42_028250 [Rhizopus arrhizus]|nr:hypothetical protein G6F42_028250 [Rhizopus arrhizus]
MSFIRGSSATANTTQNSNAMLPTKAVEYGTIRSTSANTTANGATTASANSPSTPCQRPGNLRSILPSVYGSVFEEHLLSRHLHCTVDSHIMGSFWTKAQHGVYAIDIVICEQHCQA